MNLTFQSRRLKEFENEHQIEQRTNHQCRLITIVSWDKYQVVEQRTEQRVNNDRTTSEQRVNTNKESKKVINKELLSYPVNVGESFSDPLTGRIRFNTGR